MTALSVFAFGEQMVRISDRDGEPWFVGRDVCAALGLNSVANALKRVPEDEKGVYNVHTLGGEQGITILSEPGMYRLVLTSRTEPAERFKTWIVSEVLPAIRKTGKYAPAANDDDDELAGDPAMFDSGRVFGTFVKLGMIREGRKLHGDDYARLLWRHLGLPVRKPKALPAPRRTPAPRPVGTLHDQIVAAGATFDDDWRTKP